MVDEASDKQIINDCLILKEKYYPQCTFLKLKAKFVFAQHLISVSEGMFKVSTIEVIYCPLVVEV
jgi:hypothetical protein